MPKGRSLPIPFFLVDYCPARRTDWRSLCSGARLAASCLGLWDWFFWQWNALSPGLLRAGSFLVLLSMVTSLERPSLIIQSKLSSSWILSHSLFLYSLRHVLLLIHCTDVFVYLSTCLKQWYVSCMRVRTCLWVLSTIVKANNSKIT